MNVMEHFQRGSRYNLIYTEDDRAIEVITSFFSWGINNNMKCIYYTDNPCYEELNFWFEKHCVNFSEGVKKGQIVFYSAYEVFIKKKTYYEQRQVVKLVQDALCEGYHGIAVVSDRDCFLESDFSEAELYEHEKKMLDIFRNYPAAAISCYNVDKFGVDAFFALTQLNPNFIYKRDNDIFIHNDGKINFSPSETLGIVCNFLKARDRIMKENKIFRFIGKLSEELSYRKDEREIIETALGSMCSVTSSNFGMVVLFKNNSELGDIIKHNLPQEVEEAFYKQMSGNFARNRHNIKNAKCIVMSQAEAKKHSEYYGKALEKNNIVNCIFIPFEHASEVLGYMWIGTQYKYVDYKENADLLVTACSTLANIVSDYREYKKIQESLIQASKMNALGELTGGIAHEFNNLLTPIIGFAEILRDQINDSGLIKYIDMIQNSALDGAKIVRKIQEFTNSEKKKKGIVDIDDVILKSIEISKPIWTFESQINKSLINIEYDLRSGGGVEGTPTEIREIFINLIANAVDAMPSGGIINIESFNENNNVVIRFNDTGIGMDEDTKHRVFEPFFTTKNERGNGLGLAIVYNIINSMNGRIELESKINKGTEFVIKFPLKYIEQSQEVNKSVCVNNEKYNILVIDDQYIVAQTVSEMLKSLGHAVIFTTEEENAVSIFKENEFDCIFCDLALQNTSGIELSKTLKQIRPGIPFILMTGWTGKLQKNDTQYVDKIITKPFSIEEINNVLFEAINCIRKEA